MAQVQHIEEDFKKPTDDKGYLKSWEKVIESDHLKVWRKPIPDSYLFEYKGLSPFFISFLAKKEFNLLFMLTYKLYQQAKNIKTNFLYTIICRCFVKLNYVACFITTSVAMLFVKCQFQEFYISMLQN